MARKTNTPIVVAQPRTADTLRVGIKRLEKGLEKLLNFEPRTADPENDGPLTALTAEISGAVDRAFTEGTSEHSRYMRAAHISGYHSISFGGGGPDLGEYRRNLISDVTSSKALLESAIEALKSDLEDIGPVAAPLSIEAREFTNKVFVVHGRSPGPKNEVARLLETLGIEAVILHEQPSRSKSTIEKIETFSDVDFAVVIFTPDDVGGLEGSEPNARPRQNVLFELGYFIAKLGRQNVCVLRQGDMEMLTDYVGPIWIDFDEAGAWKTALGTELQDAGFDIDWNTLMGRNRRR